MNNKERQAFDSLDSDGKWMNTAGAVFDAGWSKGYSIGKRVGFENGRTFLSYPWASFALLGSFLFGIVLSSIMVGLTQ